jgi:large subunit ribosomal protein L7Ae
MSKRKKGKGKTVALDPAILPKQVAKKVVNVLFEKRPKIFGTVQNIQPKRTSSALSNGPTTSKYSDKSLSSLSS